MRIFVGSGFLERNTDLIYAEKYKNYAEENKINTVCRDRNFYN